MWERSHENVPALPRTIDNVISLELLSLTMIFSHGTSNWPLQLTGRKK